MNYDELASELFALRSSIPKITIERKLAKMVQGERFVLNFLYEHENRAYPKDISKAMAVSTARIAKLLNEMENDELILRNSDNTDNRKIVVTITEKGIEKVNEYRKYFSKYISNLLEKLGPDDAKEYVRLNKKLLHIMNERITEKN